MEQFNNNLVDIFSAPGWELNQVSYPCKPQGSGLCKQWFVWFVLSYGVVWICCCFVFQMTSTDCQVSWGAAVVWKKIQGFFPWGIGVYWILVNTAQHLWEFLLFSCDSTHKLWSGNEITEHRLNFLGYMNIMNHKINAFISAPRNKMYLWHKFLVCIHLQQSSCVCSLKAFLGCC